MPKPNIKVQLRRCSSEDREKIVIKNQKRDQAGYKIFHNKQLGVSFDIPKNWGFVRDSLIHRNGLSGHFISTIFSEMETYNDCYDGSIFRADMIEKSLDSTLLNEDYTKNEEDPFSYTNNSSMELPPIKVFKYYEFTGISQENYSKLFCKSNKNRFLGEWESLFMSKNDSTASFSGQLSSRNVSHSILTTLKFHPKE